jgi:alkanesulfonate monooxygenase SsuD/methylene tetrahydromethanopterin reductase-like flavin-dependent oxidoreductase (luciferase family)
MSLSQRGRLNAESAQAIIDAVEAQRAEEPRLSDAAVCINAGTTLARWNYAKNVVTGSAKHEKRNLGALEQLDEEETTEEDEEGHSEQVEITEEFHKTADGTVRGIVYIGTPDDVRELLRDIIA